MKYFIEGDGITDIPPTPIIIKDHDKSRPANRHSNSRENASSSENSFPTHKHSHRLKNSSIATDQSIPESMSHKKQQFSDSYPNSSIINTLLQNNSSSVMKSSFHKSLQKYYRSNSTIYTPAFSVDPLTGTVYVMKVKILHDSNSIYILY